MADVGLSAFSVFFMQSPSFFMQSPSFLAQQRTLAENCGRSNAETLFAMTAVPCDNHIRQMLDGAPTDHFDAVFAHIVKDLPVTRKTAAEIAACGRARWKIENETFNVLKNNEYNLEHNFGHGKDTLARWSGCRPPLTASICAKVVVLRATQRRGRRDEGYDDRGRSGKECFPGPRRAADR
jgi:hypothetical protein